jgi:hypothetical protein
MASSNTFSNVLIFGGIGLAAWWIYENYFAGTTAAAITSGTTSTGTTASSSGSASSVVTGSGTSSSGSGTPPPPPPPPPTQSLASIHTALQQAITSSGDPAVTQPPTLNQNNPDYNYMATPDVFNYYLQKVYSGTILDMAQVFPGQNTGFTLAQFWAGVTPYLQKLGLSGVLAGLGMIAAAGRSWPEVAINPWNGGQWPAGGNWWWQGGGRAVQ